MYQHANINEHDAQHLQRSFNCKGARRFTMNNVETLTLVCHKQQCNNTLELEKMVTQKACDGNNAI